MGNLIGRATGTSIVQAGPMQNISPSLITDEIYGAATGTSEAEGTLIGHYLVAIAGTAIGTSEVYGTLIDVSAIVALQARARVKQPIAVTIPSVSALAVTLDVLGALTPQADVVAALTMTLPVKAVPKTITRRAPLAVQATSTPALAHTLTRRAPLAVTLDVGI